MKVLAINGSPRKNGNTAQLLQEVLAPLQTAGWETELVQLGGKKIQGCRGCGKCAELKNGRCVFDNDLLNELQGQLKVAAVIAHHGRALGRALGRVFHVGGLRFYAILFVST